MQETFSLNESVLKNTLKEAKIRRRVRVPVEMTARGEALTRR